ncbi:predicted protein [Ostreococcus lucimarinus CCE9901]|jgi:hypothetical protein|uniref:SOUL heme-binding protein n=1 Tax=Ostreococcus lucimarinus (strain CCE9901) TaxID=436017 RepID=A4RUN0_OSTLU|nr:predicted protein [Ostreococcus lucimarinus CCE9901]ABO95281.1 predicted protein [Ostreococcus lucimarinus CCE9901]|tara:strand:- start:34654 stop:35256 length:603 start_codon:yes stop_codon:yes gene_type:complete|eukprot:XP_001416988.1 predicted protein [Ostreococcus lucimarinus CCE9901]
MGSALGRISEEQPRYDVARACDGYEVRTYEACCVIETTYDPRERDEQGKSFMRLAKYIGVLSKPRNARDEKIAMTAPVFMTPDATAATRYVMQFVLPKSKFPEGAAQAPRALDPEVAVKDVPARTMAARRFSGRMRKEEIEAQTEALKKALKAAGVQLAHGEKTVVQYAGYNPPWTPGIMRTNEVLVEILWDPSADQAAA